MKKIITLSVSLAFASLALANTTNTEVIKENQSNNNIESSNIAKKSEPITSINKNNENNCQPKIVKKVLKKKKKHVVAKPVVIVKTPEPVIEPVENKSVLIESGYFHIPQNVPLENAYKFKKPISYNDIIINFSKDEKQEKNKQYFSFIDKRTGKELEKYNFSNSSISGLAVNLDLTSVNFTKNDPLEENSKFINKNDNLNCQALIVKYQLKTEKEPNFVTKFLDEKGTLVEQLPISCPLNNINTKKTTFFTDNGSIVNIGLNQKLLSNKTLGLEAHFTKNGQDFFPINSLSFSVPTDFSSFYEIPITNDSRGPFFGIKLIKIIPPNSYYVLFGFEQDGKFDWVNISTTIK